MSEEGKFDFHKMIDEIKRFVMPEILSETEQNDPVGYYLSQINKASRILADLQKQQIEQFTVVMELLGGLNKTFQQVKLGRTAEAVRGEDPIQDGVEEEVPKELTSRRIRKGKEGSE